jgi:hypothetical protein
MKLADQDLPLFAQIITGLDSIDSYKKTPYPVDNVVHYLEFYNFLRDNYFSELADSIMPYTKKPLGIIFYANKYGSFRARTNNYPMPIVEVNDPNLVQQAFHRSFNQQFLNDLQPVGMFYMGGMEGLDEYPQRASYIFLLKELSDALAHRMLNETKAQDILRERIFDVLLYNSTMRLMQDPLPNERYWKLLGYNSIEELKETKVSDLAKRIDDLLKSFDERLKRRDALYPSYFARSSELLATQYVLGQLDSNNPLGSLRYSREKLSEHAGHDIETIKNEIETLIPIIIENYKKVFAENFPALAKHSRFFADIDKLAIVEIINLRSRSEFPTFSYVIFPHGDKPESIKFVDSRYGQSITGRLKYPSLHGQIEWGSVTGGFGYSEIDITIDGERLYEPAAWVIKARFSSNTPVLDQVYSLISSDLKFILNARTIHWTDYGYSRLANDQYVRRSAQAMLAHK